MRSRHLLGRVATRWAHGFLGFRFHTTSACVPGHKHRLEAAQVGNGRRARPHLLQDGVGAQRHEALVRVRLGVLRRPARLAAPCAAAWKPNLARAHGMHMSVRVRPRAAPPRSSCRSLPSRMQPDLARAHGMHVSETCSGVWGHYGAGTCMHVSETCSVACSQVWRGNVMPCM